jgi:hypothetical protein
MTLVDDRGRVGGRLNLIDAVAAIVLLVLIPVAYGAYLLFRAPPSTVSSIYPTQLYQGRNLRIVVNGTNLRPFMRVSLNAIQARTFLLGSPKYVEVDLPDLAPGTYDVVLYDYMQEVDRLPKALTILPQAPQPTVQMEVDGAFHGLPDAVVKLIHPGTRFPPDGGDAALAEVLTIGGTAPAQLRLRAGDNTVTVAVEHENELRATLRVKCFVTTDTDGTMRCNMSGPQQPVPVQPDANLALMGPQGWVNFQISDVRPIASMLPPPKPPAAK